MGVAREDIEAASQGNSAAMRRVLMDMADSHDKVASHLGINAGRMTSARPDIAVAAPLATAIDVLGADGHFYVTAVAAIPKVVDRRAKQMPRQGGKFPDGDAFGDMDARGGRSLNLKRRADGRRDNRVLFEFQSANNLSFDAAANVTTYGPTTQNKLDITDPNQTKFWRVHARYQDSDWSGWGYYQNPLTCGPVALWSGVLSTHGTAINNNGNTYTGTTPLSQFGVSSRINVAATAWTMGGDSPAYLAGSTDPGVLGTYYVYADDPKHAGGVVTYLTTQQPSILTANDHRLFFGKITTVGGGGGTGNGGGAGACCGPDVLIEMADGSFKRQAELRRGDIVRGFDSLPDEVVRIDTVPMPCFRIESTKKRVLQQCSGSHALMLEGGGWVSVFDLLPGNKIETVDGPETIESKRMIGEFDVYPFELARSKTFISDGFISHNLAMK